MAYLYEKSYVFDVYCGAYVYSLKEHDMFLTHQIKRMIKYKRVRERKRVLASIIQFKHCNKVSWDGLKKNFDFVAL